MKNNMVMMVLCRRFIGDLLMEAFKKRGYSKTISIYEFKRAKNAALVYNPAVALIEIPERHGEPALEALAVCEDIKEASPGCKVMLMCPEIDEKSVESCIEAKKDNKIEDFLFYDSSIDYLVSKLKSMQVSKE